MKHRKWEYSSTHEKHNGHTTSKHVVSAVGSHSIVTAQDMHGNEIRMIHEDLLSIAQTYDICVDVGEKWALVRVLPDGTLAALPYDYATPWRPLTDARHPGKILSLIEAAMEKKHTIRIECWGL